MQVPAKFLTSMRHFPVARGLAYSASPMPLQLFCMPRHAVGSAYPRTWALPIVSVVAATSAPSPLLASPPPVASAPAPGSLLANRFESVLAVFASLPLRAPPLALAASPGIIEVERRNAGPR